MSRMTHITRDIQTAEAQHIGYGQGRKSQEDRCISRFVQTQKGFDLHVAIVVDSIGDTATSRRVGQLIVDTIIQYLYASEDDVIQTMLRNAVGNAHQVVQKVLGNLENTNWLGASVTLAVIHQGMLFTAHVGNTRAYLIRGGKIQQLTIDHTLANEMISTGNWTIDEAVDHPRRGELARCVGTPGGRVDIDIGVRLDDLDPLTSKLHFEGLPLQSGDDVLLCTDGLIKERRVGGGHYTEPSEIVRIVQQNTPQDAANTLVSVALGRQVNENVSIVIMEIPGKKKHVGLVREINPVLLLIGFGIIGVSLLIGLLLPGVISVLQPTPEPIPSSTVPAGFVYVSTYQEGVGQYYTPGQSPEYLINETYAFIMTGTRVNVNDGVIKLGLPDRAVIYLGANSVIYFNLLSSGIGNEQTTLMLEQGSTLINNPDDIVNIAVTSQYLLQASDSLVGIENYVSYFMVDCFRGTCNLYDENAQLAVSLQEAEHIRVENGQITDLAPENGNIRYLRWVDKLGQPGAAVFSEYQTPTAKIQTLTSSPEPTLTPESSLTPTGATTTVEATEEGQE